MRRVRLHPLAETDLIERSHFYSNEGGGHLGERFFDTAMSTLDIVAERPEEGSLRIGELSGIADLRVRQVKGFPCGWFYFSRTDHVDVVRLLAYAQNLPAELGELFD